MELSSVNYPICIHKNFNTELLQLLIQSRKELSTEKWRNGVLEYIF